MLYYSDAQVPENLWNTLPLLGSTSFVPDDTMNFGLNQDQIGKIIIFPKVFLVLISQSHTIFERFHKGRIHSIINTALRVLACKISDGKNS